jgi:hypothetical protein
MVEVGRRLYARPLVNGVVPLPEAECRVLAEQRRAAQKKGR